MAPERLGEHKGWQLKKSDVWAVGAIAYEMFVGKRCFGGNGQREVFGKILRGQWSWPGHRTPSDSMQDLIRQCLDVDPSNRCSASEILQHSWFDDLNDRNDRKTEETESEGVSEPLNDVADDQLFQSNKSVNTVPTESILDQLVSLVESNPLQDLLVKLRADII